MRPALVPAPVTSIMPPTPIPVAFLVPSILFTSPHHFVSSVPSLLVSPSKLYLPLVNSFLSLLYNPFRTLYLPYFPSSITLLSLLSPHCWSHFAYPQYLHSFMSPFFLFLPPISSNFSPLTPSFAFEYFLLFSSTSHLDLCHSSSFSVISPRYQYYEIIIS